MPFPQAPAGARLILGGWRRSVRLWCCGRSCWWWSRRMNKPSSLVGSGRGRRRASERRLQSRIIPSEAKPGSLWTYKPAPSPAATPRVCHRPPDCTRGSPHSSAHPGTLCCWLFKPTSKMWGGMMWSSLKTSPKTITVAENFVFISLGTFLLFVAIQICILRVLAMVQLS